MAGAPCWQISNARRLCTDRPRLQRARADVRDIVSKLADGIRIATRPTMHPVLWRRGPGHETFGTLAGHKGRALALRVLVPRRWPPAGRGDHRSMADFFSHNATAILALVGVLIGAGVSFLNAWIMRNRDLNLKVWEKFLDRRINAHESVVQLALKMRVMVTFEKFDSSDELIRAPEVMMSKRAFDRWLEEFTRKSLPATTWLSPAVKRELYFVQDYLVTLHTHLSGIPSPSVATVGSFLRQDFIDLSSSLEKVAFEHFGTEATKRRLYDLTEHYKYPREETDRRFQNTVLIGKWTDVQALIHG
jgi:hypothetical protein